MLADPGGKEVSETLPLDELNLVCIVVELLLEAPKRPVNGAELEVPPPPPERLILKKIKLAPVNSCDWPLPVVAVIANAALSVFLLGESV